MQSPTALNREIKMRGDRVVGSVFIIRDSRWKTGREGAGEYSERSPPAKREFRSSNQAQEPNTISINTVQNSARPTWPAQRASLTAPVSRVAERCCEAAGYRTLM